MLRITKSVTINRPREEVYECWRELDNLPRFIPELQELTLLPGGRSRWVVKGRAAATLEWDAEITCDRPGELLSWRTLDGSEVPNEGHVRFAEAPAGRGTELRVEIRYDPPAGFTGLVVARLLGDDPESLVSDSLRRFKQILETGEVLRSARRLEGAGQSVERWEGTGQPILRAVPPLREEQPL